MILSAYAKLGQMTRPKYTQDQRREAVELAERVGNDAAGELLGIPSGTVRYMRSIARKSSAMRGMLVPASPDITLPTLATIDDQPWEDRRESMPDRLGRIAELALVAATSAIEVGNGTEGDKLVSIATRLIDRAETLRGRNSAGQTTIVAVLGDAWDALKGMQRVRDADRLLLPEVTESATDQPRCIEAVSRPGNDIA